MPRRCSGRAIPDVSADADPATCAYIYVGGLSACAGGTSLSAPIWAAIAADWNVVNAAAGKSALGFSAPLLYQLGSNPATEAIDFHDVTNGNNGFPALPGWDQVTGWGSPNLGNLSATAAPGAPTGVTATAGDKQATVAFTPLAANPAVGDSWYTVTASPGGQHASGTAGPLTVTGLTDGTSYTFTVTATNSVGTGPASGASNSVVPGAPATVPGAPTGVSAVAGNTQATVSFSAPASNGGSAITSYTVTSSPGWVDRDRCR